MSLYNFTYCSQIENHIWIQNGFSHCFLETIVDSITLIFTIIFSIIQILFYKKYSTQVKHYVLPYSQLFGLQMVLNGLMPFITFIHFAIGIIIPEYYENEQQQSFYGYMILSLFEGFIVWPMICILILLERNHMLPTVPRKGHGLILIIIWTWIFGSKNLIFINILSNNWFFKLKTNGDIIRFILFLLEYSITGIILILGIQAPGIPSFQNSESFMRLTSNEYISYSTLQKNTNNVHDDDGDEENPNVIIDYTLVEEEEEEESNTIDTNKNSMVTTKMEVHHEISKTSESER